MTDRVQIIAVDSGFAEGLPPDELAQATRALVAPVMRLDGGILDPQRLAGADGVAAASALLVRGALTREIALADRVSAELLGPGDILRLVPVSESLLPHEVRWVATEPTLLAILDDRFALAARRWPSLAAVVNERLHEQAERRSLHVAISQLGRVELRLLALFWHLADRWGRVTAQGVHVPLNLTHESLGRLVGAQRPTVTLALMELSNAGNVTRAATGGWLLAPESLELLNPTWETKTGRPVLRAVPVAPEAADVSG